MNKKSDSYSDLETARRLSRLLSVSPDLPMETEPDKVEYDYVSFNEKVSRDEGSVTVKDNTGEEGEMEKAENDMAPAVYPISLLEKYQNKSQFWDEIVNWAADVTNADPAFICQSGGMLVAENGDLHDIEPEALGGRLLNMLDQAKKLSEISEDTSSITLEFDKYWVTGITLNVYEELILLVLITANQLKETVISAVKKELSQLLSI